jgi:hypothetical protein
MIIKALRKVGDSTNSPPRMDSKEDRIRLQKLVYLLRVGGYGPARTFNFNLYMNGPYSPELAEVYYQFEETGVVDATPANDIPATLLAEVVDADRGGVVFLEALATTLDLTDSLRRKGAGKAALGPGLKWAESIKPQIAKDTWGEVRSFLQTHPVLAGIT